MYIADLGNYRIRKVTPEGIISTSAGNGSSYYSGDGGQATEAQLSSSRAVVTDNIGNIFITDTYNHRIRKIATDGIITTIAGTGIAGYNGDNIPAKQADLNTPHGVVIDSLNNLYISESGNNRIRKVTPEGVISTIAGSGTHGFSGDGGQATIAQLSYPKDITLDSLGNLYITDAGNYRIRKVTPEGIISTVAGIGTEGFSGDGGQATQAQLDYPNGIATDSDNNLYIVDSDNNRIRKVTANGIINTIIGTGVYGNSGDGGLAVDAQLGYPRGIFIDSTDNIFIVDRRNDRIRKITPGGIISNVAGTGYSGFSGDGGQATQAQLAYPEGLAIDNSNNLYFSDSHRIRKITPEGIITTIAGNGITGYIGDGSDATLAQLNSPNDMTFDATGNLYIADSGNHRIRKITSEGIISTIAGNGIRGFSGDGGQAVQAQFSYPRGIALDSKGNLYIADTSNNKVRKVTPAGVISTVIGKDNGEFFFTNDTLVSDAQLYYPIQLTLDKYDNLYILDGDDFISRISEVSGGIIRTIAGGNYEGSIGDGGPATLARFAYPHGLTIDKTGNFYLADSWNNRIRKVTKELSDNDKDFIAYFKDNCPDLENTDQTDTDNDLMGNICDLDDENDGMPDSWENANGLNSVVNDASLDKDNDSFTNLQEYQAGTNPQDATSFPSSTSNPCQLTAVNINAGTSYSNTIQIQSGHSITSNGSVVVNSGANISYTAPTIRLTAGFNAISGSTFSAEVMVVDCSSEVVIPKAIVFSAKGNSKVSDKTEEAVTSQGESAFIDESSKELNKQNLPIPIGLKQQLSKANSIDLDIKEIQSNISGNLITFSTKVVLLDNDTNNLSDIYAYDKQTETLKLISAARGKESANGASTQVRINASGEYIVYISEATNLNCISKNGYSDNNNVADIYLHKISSDETIRVSFDEEGSSIQYDANNPAIYGDKPLIFYDSSDSFEQQHVYQMDKMSRNIKGIKISEDYNNFGEIIDNSYPEISADGRYIQYYGLSGEEQSCTKHILDRETGHLKVYNCLSK